jgi:transcriptional regulator with XRE-family HTH domain
VGFFISMLEDLMPKPRDTFENWIKNNQWPKIRSFLVDSVRCRISQKEICARLGVTQSVFSKLKSKHPEINEAIAEAKLNLKLDLVNKVYQLAMGYEDVVEDQIIEDNGQGATKKRKIHRIKRQVPPDLKAIQYLLMLQGGREFSPRKEELDLQEKKIDSKEEWNDEPGHEDSE